jgi:hypothetical protein
MSLTEQTSRELEQLAKQMLTGGLGQISYRSFGTLVRQDSEEAQKFENEILIGEVTVDDRKFLYFAK